MHRLDTDTSGCLLFARSPKARAAFQRAFETRSVEKYYVAVVGSEIAESDGVIDVPLAKRSSAEAGWRMVADEHGVKAITRWRRLFVRDGSTLVEFRPVTGRTHQIRVHAREAFGRGIVGDRVYGMPGGPMLLHASRLVVPRDGKPAIDVTAPLPDYFGGMGRCGLRTWKFPRTRSSEMLPRRDRSRGQNVNKVATAVQLRARPVPPRPPPGRLRAAEADRRKPHHGRRRAARHRAGASARRTRTAPMRAAVWRK